MVEPANLAIGDLVDYAPPESLGEIFPLYWQMTRAERFTFIHLLSAFKPDLSLEIGTYKGGSLQVLCRYSKEVVSIDIDPGVAAELGGMFANAAFRCGDSSVVLPAVVDEINTSGKQVGFVLIDGDHSERGVKRDIEAVLRLKPRRPICVVMHDSFHPPCRAGMLSAAWAQCPHVHYVEIDFVGGIFLPGRTSVDHSMYGGFAMALLKPEMRESELTLLESQRQKFEIVRRFAATSGFVALPGSEPSLPNRIKSKILRLLREAAPRKSE